MSSEAGSSGAHDIYCVFLACAVSLLKSGLEDILGSIPRSSSYLRTVCAACCKVITNKEKEIFSTLSNMLGVFHECDLKVVSSARVCCELDSVGGPHLSFSAIQRGENGRLLTTLQTVTRGTGLLSDFPYISCVASSCSCSEESLLIEHVKMAVCAKYTDRRDRKKHNVFLKNVMSGFDISEDNLCKWSNHLHFTMILTSALISRYALRQDYTANAASPNHIPTVPMLDEQVLRSQHLSDCLELCEILGRLPLNVHAVTKISSNCHTANHVNVEQVRIGYNLYLTASAVNHSCVPNACIKFHAPQCASNSTGMRESVLDQLLATRVEVVATENIARKSEVTVSYGPLRGVHTSSDRRQILQSQYLFHCQCSGCLQDQQLQQSEQVAAMARYSQLTNAEGRLSQQMQREPQTVLDTVLLCETLKGLNSEVVDIQSTLTRILHRRSGDPKTLLCALEQQRVMQYKKKLLALQTKYFPETLSWMSVPPMEQGVPLTAGQTSNSLCSEFCGILLAYLDVHAHLLALQHNYSSAAELVHTSITVMVGCGRYRERDVVVARERVKLAQLQFSSGQRGHCLATVRRALEDLRPCVSEDDPDWIEANSILSFIVH